VKDTTLPNLVDRLAQHRTLGSAPRAELEWLVAHGYVVHVDVGEAITPKDQPVNRLYIVLSGRFGITLDQGAGPRKVMEWKDGDVTGLLPYSRLGKPPGEGLVDEAGDVLMLDKEHFPALIHQCPIVTETLVHVMLDRARIFRSNELVNEKMVSLGKLSAGLAHELNNPASAAARSAALLIDGLESSEVASRELGAARLSDVQMAAVDHVRGVCLAKPAAAAMSPIEHADRVDALAAWLAAHGSTEVDAAALADTAVSLEALDSLAAVMQGKPLDATLRWVAAGCSVRALASEVEKAASRIHDLVSAVKRFTYMDHHAVPEAVNLAQGLSDTVIVLGSKARARSVAIELNLPSDLPRVSGFGGELNQVWSNLIDNAIDAAPDGGRVTISAARGLGSVVVVSVMDNGAGIPPELKNRIFDPFFTTKPIGKGTGLGLDIAMGLIRRHQGAIDVQSEPGRTEFRVSLPLAKTA